MIGEDLKHPNIEFAGIDLSVVNAQQKHGNVSNLTFKKGYALDLLRDGLSADLVFASSTFCIFAPKEMQAYIDVLQSAKRIIISDPVTNGYSHSRDPVSKSRHMDLYMWWHNYFGYLMNANWTIEKMETVGYSYTHNSNAKVVLISAKKNKTQAIH